MPTHTDKNLEHLHPRQENLSPDYLDNPLSTISDEKILPSFGDLKRKTLQSLYGLDKNKDYNHALLMDKSPKGSVDEKIRSLVDLINAHPSFATLSSCSGRISLFDPNHEATISIQSDPSTETIDSEINMSQLVSTQTSTGKGYGAWLISSHAPISPFQLKSALQEQAKSNSHHALVFKHEPLLLHVAASNLSRARQLLKLALDLGFRESGTVITPKRVTVAIRSHSLTLTVPLASKGRLRPNEEYMEELVREANERFEKNEEKLRRLENTIKNTIYMCGDDNEISRDVGENVSHSASIMVSSIPALNLWGHTSLLIPKSKRESGITKDEEIIVFGGYGVGPNGNKKSASRSDTFYSLRRSEGQWDNAWSARKQEQLNDMEDWSAFHGFLGERSSLTAREGCASCVLPQRALSLHDDQSPLAVTFGGRSSPARPNNDLHLISFENDKVLIMSPKVLGEAPAPRWGHSLTALSGKDGSLAILIGGRDESSILSSVYILSCTQNLEDDSSQNYHLIWERISLSIPRFYHSATKLEIPKSATPEQSESIIIQGGLFSTALIPSMTNAEDKDNKSKDANLIISLSEGQYEMRNCESKTSGKFGASACSLTTSNSLNGDSYLFSSGGLPCDTLGDSNPTFTLDAIKYNHNAGKSSGKNFEYSIQLAHALDQDLNLGSMVHHSCLEVSSSEKGIAEVVLLGGVPAFAFGQSFANSFHFIISSNGEQLSKQKVLKKTMDVMGKPKRRSILEPNGSGKGETHVLFVNKRSAKELKVALEKGALLDRSYRMVKAEAKVLKDVDAASHIAVPVTLECVAITSEKERDAAKYPWLAVVHGSGKQIMPFSSVVLGRK